MIYSITHIHYLYQKIYLLSEICLRLEVYTKSEESLAVNTHSGLYQYNRLPFGVKPALEISQQIMDITLFNLQSLAVYPDYVVIVAVIAEELIGRSDI